MRAALLLLGLLLFGFTAHAQTLDVVFDIDWTLVYPLKEAPPKITKDIIEVHGQYYRISDGASEVLSSLKQKKDIRISFFSGGDKARNLELLGKIKLSDKESAADLAYKILHKEDLLKISEDPSLPFTSQYKKDLSLVNSDLDRVILIDDSKDFTLPQQRKNQLWLGETYNFYENASELPTTPRQYDPPDLARWSEERRKLLTVQELIEDLYDKRHQPNLLEHMPRRLPSKLHPCNQYF